MRVLFSLYSEDVQFADFLNVHPPSPTSKEKRIFMLFLS